MTLSRSGVATVCIRESFTYRIHQEQGTSTEELQGLEILDVAVGIKCYRGWDFLLGEGPYVAPGPRDI